MKMNKIRNRHLLALDILLCVFAYALTFALVFPLSVVSGHFVPGAWMILLTAVIYVVISGIFGIYRVDWVYARGE